MPLINAEHQSSAYKSLSAPTGQRRIQSVAHWILRPLSAVIALSGPCKVCIRSNGFDALYSSHYIARRDKITFDISEQALSFRICNSVLSSMKQFDHHIWLVCSLRDVFSLLEAFASRVVAFIFCFLMIKEEVAFEKRCVKIQDLRDL